MKLEAVETDLTANDVPEDELWNLEELRNYKIKLVNNGGKAEIINFEEYRNQKNRESI